MTTEAKNPEIQLTEAEIAMIQLKREQEELNKKKEENARLIKEGEEIQKIKKRIETDQKRDAQLVAEIEKLFNELPNKNEYKLEDHSKNEIYKLSHYDSSKPEEEREQIYFNEKIERVGKKIVHKSGSYMTAHFHRVNSGKGFWSSCKEDGTVRFSLEIKGAYDGKNGSLVSAKTIDKKIQEYVAEQKRKTETEKAKLEGIEWLINQINEKYPQAVVTQEQESEYYLDSFRRRDWREGAKYVQAAFISGLILTFTWTKNSGGELEVVRKGFNLSKVSDEKKEAFINSLI